MLPLFSVIIPCYNQAVYLTDCLNSILEQSESNWEAIIINDGSTDNTRSVAQKFCSIDSRIKLIEKNNGGLSSARNEGLKNAKGNRIIFMDADDLFFPDCLEHIKKSLSNNLSDDLLLIQYGYTHILENKSTILHEVYPKKRRSLIPEIFYGNLGPPNSVCISKYICELAGSFDEELKSVEDWDYWIRIAKCGGKIKQINKTLVYYRYVKNSMSRNAFVMYEAFKKVISRANQKDIRITIDSELNKTYDINTNNALQEGLIRLLGVSIMQGKIEESLTLFKNETTKPINNILPKEFEPMSSYLSFRYWYSKEEIGSLINTTIPLFITFFKKLGYSKNKIQKIIFLIFHQHFYHRNILKYGKYLGKIINVFIRQTQLPLFIKLTI